jgi:hypothetical protein
VPSNPFRLRWDLLKKLCIFHKEKKKKRKKKVDEFIFIIHVIALFVVELHYIHNETCIVAFKVVKPLCP